ncbi:hypothetical protein BDQ17DRAFT_1427746 [Cyathus striatus]|nr:hypothetical protein BDQ17DRAFT_1427746 [Cyathus striatus]
MAGGTKPKNQTDNDQSLIGSRKQITCSAANPLVQPPRKRPNTKGSGAGTAQLEEASEQQQIQQLMLLNPDIITKYLLTATSDARTVNTSEDAVESANEGVSEETENAPVAESEDDEETLENTYNSSNKVIKPVASLSAAAFTNLHTVSMSGAPRPAATPTSQLLARGSLPPSFLFSSGPPVSSPPSELSFQPH